MKRTELKELLRKAIYKGPTKKANKAKKKALGFTRIGRHDPDAHERSLGFKKDHPMRGAQRDFFAAKNKASRWDRMSKRDREIDRRDKEDTNRFTRKYGWEPDPTIPPEQRSLRQWQGVDSTGKAKLSPVPAHVLRAVSGDKDKKNKGRIIFGKYYDAQGNYLGKTTGGKWIDPKDDPNPRSQLELYNKIKEVETKKYTTKDKELVKEMVRKIIKSCK